MSLARRRFMISVACAGAALAAPSVNGRARAKVVVVGGGAGGASVARKIAIDSSGQVDVTLVEPNARHTTCYFSNLYLGGLRSFESLQHGYDGLMRAGVGVIPDFAAAIDRRKRRVVLAGGEHLPMIAWWWRQASISSRTPLKAGLLRRPTGCRMPTGPVRRRFFWQR